MRSLVKMKKWMMIGIVVCAFVTSMEAQAVKKPALTKEEFRERQVAFITGKAGLSPEEADRFFPVYFELQDRKKAINSRVHGYFKQGKVPGTTDVQYEELTKSILKARIESAELELNYYDKFRKILPPGKIFKVQQAEMKFHRELLKNANKENLRRKK